MAKILLVEDDKALSESYLIMLQKEGHNVISAEDGGIALEKAKTFAPDLILLDLLMPRTNGLEFLKRYGKDDGPRAKVIVLTNLGMIQAELEATRLGADKYIVKSTLSPGELAALIRKELGEAEQ